MLSVTRNSVAVSMTFRAQLNDRDLEMLSTVRNMPEILKITDPRQKRNRAPSCSWRGYPIPGMTPLG